MYYFERIKNALVFGLVFLMGCDAQDLATFAKFDCNTMITLNSEEKEACVMGVDFVTETAEEAGIGAFSSNQAYIAVARRSEKLCDLHYADNDRLLNACYMGIQACRDTIEN